MTDSALICEPSNSGSLRPVADFLRSKGWEIESVESYGAAAQKLRKETFRLFLVCFSEINLKSLTELFVNVKNSTDVLVIGPNDVRFAMSAMQAGARNYWAVPFLSQDFESFYNEGKLNTRRIQFGYHREETLLQIIKEIALTMELDGLVNILVDSAMELTGADGGAILLLDEKSNMLVMKAVRGFRGLDRTSEIFGFPEKAFYEILSKKEAVWLHPDPPVYIPTGQKVDAVIVTPTWWKDQPLAELVMVKYAGSPDFTRDDFKVLSLLNEEITGAVHNAIIHYKTKELTIKDDLTEAYNRRYFEQYLDEEFIRAKRYDSMISLIFFDVDNLKEVNLKYGHLTGSKTLQEIAHRIILTVRGIDKVVRYGGDEFCVVLPETDADGAYQVADRIRNTIASRPFRVTENTSVNLTGSIGIACYPIHASNKEELVRQADRAMFTIKNQSKNAIAIAKPL
jgi:diguanylate cyclase (GGDEF)-like protein